MKRLSLAVIAAVMFLGGFQTLADPFTNSIPTAISFETYTVGTNDFVPAMGWYLGADTVAAATNLDYSANKPSVNYPLEGAAAHTRIMQFAGTVTNPVVVNAENNVYVDAMVLPGRRDETPSSNVVEDAQMAAFVNSNGHLTIWRGVDTDQTIGLESTEWLELTNSPVGEIDSNDWIRLTIHVTYANEDDIVFFRVFLNGLPVTAAEGYQNADTDSFSGPVMNGPWFLSANQFGYFREIALSGDGFVDDLVMTNGLPSMQAIVSVVASAGAGGTIEPSGTVYIQAGTTTNFTITASNFYYVADVKTNGATVGGPFPSPYGYTWSNAAGGTLDAIFAASLTPNGIPLWWLDANGLETNDTENGSLYDEGDGMPSGDEYYAGTDPTDSNSVLRLLAPMTVNGTNVVRWLSASGPDGYARYGVEYTTNLVGSWIWAENVIRNPPTNTWYKPVTDAHLYYRISVTN